MAGIKGTAFTFANIHNVTQEVLKNKKNNDKDDKNKFIFSILNDCNNSETMQGTSEEGTNFGVTNLINENSTSKPLFETVQFLVLNNVPQNHVIRNNSQRQIMQKSHSMILPNKCVGKISQTRFKLKAVNIQQNQPTKSQANNAQFNNSNCDVNSFNRNMKTVHIPNCISNNVKLGSTGHVLKICDMSTPMPGTDQSFVALPNAIINNPPKGTQVRLIPQTNQSQNTRLYKLVSLKDIQKEVTNSKNVIENNPNVCILRSVPSVNGLAQKMKTVTSTTPISRQKQVSVLKNQQKVAFNNSNKQTGTLTVQNVANTSVFQNVSLSTDSITESVTLMQTENITCAPGDKICILKQGKNVSNERINPTKQLGSIENPLWITQHDQGMKYVTPSVFKQIQFFLRQPDTEVRTMQPTDLQLHLSPNQSFSNQILELGKESIIKKGKRGRPKRDTYTVTPTNTQSSINEEENLLKARVGTTTRFGRKTRTPVTLKQYYDLDSSHSVPSNLDNLAGHAKTMHHLETDPDHESCAQLSPLSSTPKLNTNSGQDTAKFKSSKRRRVPSISEEAKSKKRQTKLQTAIDECEDSEIIKVATKPVLKAQSLFDLLLAKSNDDARIFVHEVKQFLAKLRVNAGFILTPAKMDADLSNDSTIINDQLCNILGLEPGLYKINKEALKKVSSSNPCSNTCENEEFLPKRPKLNYSEEVKENVEDHMSSGFSESSDLSTSDFLNDKRDNTIINSTCPEVLTVLTLMPNNSSPANNGEANKCNNVSKLLISNPEIQNQISDNPGFQKVDIMSSKILNYQKTDSHIESFMLENNIELSNFCNKMEDKYEQPKTDDTQQSFIKLQETEQSFRLENGAMETYPKLNDQNHQTIQNDMENTSQNFIKEFQSVQNIVPIPGNCDTNIFVDTENMNEINSYSNSAELNHEMYKNLSAGLEDFESERLMKMLHNDGIIQNNEILENSVISNDLNLPTNLDFTVLAELNASTS